MTITVRLIEAQRIAGLLTVTGKYETNQIVGVGDDHDQAKSDITKLIQQKHGKATDVRFRYARVRQTESES